MSRKRRTRSKLQSKKKSADSTRSEQDQNTSARSAGNPICMALESEPAAAKPCEATREDLSCDGDMPIFDMFVGEPADSKEELILNEIQAVQVYMDALLKRVCGENAPNFQFVPSARSSKQELAQAGSEKPLPAATTGPDETPCCDCQPLAELKARSRAPESAGWGLMRELANAHARAAIDTHLRLCRAKSILNNGAACLACLIGTVVALTCDPTLGQTMSIGRMAGVVASIYFLHASYLSTRAWLASRPSTLD